MVVPNQFEAAITIGQAFQELIQLNEGHAFSYSRDELVQMLDEGLAGPFDTIKGTYDFFGAVLKPLGLELDYERIKLTRPKITEMLR